jgi:hypothetical protein
MDTGLVGEATGIGLVCAATELVGAGPALPAFVVACARDDAEKIIFGYGRSDAMSV